MNSLNASWKFQIDVECVSRVVDNLDDAMRCHVAFEWSWSRIDARLSLKT